MRDEEMKRERGYKEAKSIVRPDGSEKLVGKDWLQRKWELHLRSNGRCEQLNSDGLRCRALGQEPHHKKPRSKGRDDRLENLENLCHTHHSLLDWKKLHWRPSHVAQSNLL